MKAVGYIRVSTEEQVREGVSLDNQRSKIELFCAAKDWTLKHVYADEGKSGASLNRDAVQELINDCKRGKFDVVVIYKLDRLTRSVKDLGWLIDLFEKSGVAFSSVSDNFDTTTANGKLVLNILGSVAQWERDIISERTRDALAHKKEQRQIYSPLPLGFEAGEDGRLVENEKELEVVSKIRALREDGLSYQKIVDRLNNTGVPTKNGGRWSKSVVYGIVHNTLYA
jgi:site-specific DNA recombinase